MVSFGRSSSEQKSSSSSMPVKLDLYSPQQMALFNQLYGQISPGLSGPVPSYPGQMYTATTPEEAQYFKTVGTLPEQMPGRQKALETALSGKPAYEINPDTTAQFFEQGVKPQMLQEYRETTLPQLRESFVGPGFYGGARSQAEFKAGEHLATNLATARATLNYQDELARRQALTDAANRQAQIAPQVYEAGMSDIGTAGAYARMIEQEKKQADLQRWLMGETVDGVSPTQYNPFLTLAFNYLGLQPYGYGNMSSGKSTGSSSGWNFGVNWNAGSGSSGGSK